MAIDGSRAESNLVAYKVYGQIGPEHSQNGLQAGYITVIMSSSPLRKFCS